MCWICGLYDADLQVIPGYHCLLCRQCARAIRAVKRARLNTSHLRPFIDAELRAARSEAMLERWERAKRLGSPFAKKLGLGR